MGLYAVNSMVVGILLIFLLTRGGAGYLLPVYLVPGAVFLPLLLLRDSLTRQELNYLGNPMLAFLACMVLAGIQERMRLNQFRFKEIIKEQYKELRKKDIQITKELKLATNIQNCLIPQSMPVLPGVNFHSIYQPMDQLGGDFFDFIAFEDPKLLGIVIGDVSGHGVPSALITGMVKTLIRTADRELYSPRELLEYININMIGQTGGNFITAFYGVMGKSHLPIKDFIGHIFDELLKFRNNTKFDDDVCLIGMEVS